MLYSTVLGRAGNETLGLQPLFESYRRFDEQPELIRQCFMNVLLYFPGGLCLAAALPEKWYKSVKLILPVVLLFLLSVGTEYMQFIRFLGLAEMDDVMHNTIGALCGSGTVYFISRITM